MPNIVPHLDQEALRKMREKLDRITSSTKFEVSTLAAYRIHVDAKSLNKQQEARLKILREATSRSLGCSATVKVMPKEPTFEVQEDEVANQPGNGNNGFIMKGGLRR